MIIQIIYKLNPTPFALWPCDGVSTLGGRVRKAGFKGGGGGAFFFRFLRDSPLCKFRCYVEGLREVENAAIAVEVSCVLDIMSGTALIISSGRVLICNCSLKARYLFCN